MKLVSLVVVATFLCGRKCQIARFNACGCIAKYAGRDFLRYSHTNDNKTFACQKTRILAVSMRSGICEHWKTGRTARRNRKNTGPGAILAMIGSFPEFENACMIPVGRNLPKTALPIPLTRGGTR